MKIKTYEVQTWMGNVLATFNTLDEAVDYKFSLSDDDAFLEDIYIIGKNEDGSEFAPDFS